MEQILKKQNRQYYTGTYIPKSFKTFSGSTISKTELIEHKTQGLYKNIYYDSKFSYLTKTGDINFKKNQVKAKLRIYTDWAVTEVLNIAEAITSRINVDYSSVWGSKKTTANRIRTIEVEEGYEIFLAQSLKDAKDKIPGSGLASAIRILNNELNMERVTNIDSLTRTNLAKILKLRINHKPILLRMFNLYYSLILREKELRKAYRFGESCPVEIRSVKNSSELSGLVRDSTGNVVNYLCIPFNVDFNVYGIVSLICSETNRVAEFGGKRLSGSWIWPGIANLRVVNYSNTELKKRRSGMVDSDRMGEFIIEYISQYHCHSQASEALDLLTTYFMNGKEEQNKALGFNRADIYIANSELKPMLLGPIVASANYANEKEDLLFSLPNIREFLRAANFSAFLHNYYWFRTINEFIYEYNPIVKYDFTKLSVQIRSILNTKLSFDRRNKSSLMRSFGTCSEALLGWNLAQPMIYHINCNNMHRASRNLRTYLVKARRCLSFGSIPFTKKFIKHSAVAMYIREYKYSFDKYELNSKMYLKEEKDATTQCQTIHSMMHMGIVNTIGYLITYNDVRGSEDWYMTVGGMRISQEDLENNTILSDNCIQNKTIDKRFKIRNYIVIKEPKKLLYLVKRKEKVFSYKVNYLWVSDEDAGFLNDQETELIIPKMNKVEVEKATPIVEIKEREVKKKETREVIKTDDERDEGTEEESVKEEEEREETEEEFESEEEEKSEQLEDIKEEEMPKEKLSVIDQLKNNKKMKVVMNTPLKNLNKSVFEVAYDNGLIKEGTEPSYMRKILIMGKNKLMENFTVLELFDFMCNNINTVTQQAYDKIATIIEDTPNLDNLVLLAGLNVENNSCVKDYRKIGAFNTILGMPKDDKVEDEMRELKNLYSRNTAIQTLKVVRKVCAVRAETSENVEWSNKFIKYANTINSYIKDMEKEVVLEKNKIFRDENGILCSDKVDLETMQYVKQGLEEGNEINENIARNRVDERNYRVLRSVVHKVVKTIPQDKMVEAYKRSLKHLQFDIKYKSVRNLPWEWLTIYELRKHANIDNLVKMNAIDRELKMQDLPQAIELRKFKSNVKNPNVWQIIEYTIYFNRHKCTLISDLWKNRQLWREALNKDYQYKKKNNKLMGFLKYEVVEEKKTTTKGKKYTIYHNNGTMKWLSKESRHTDDRGRTTRKTRLPNYKDVDKELESGKNIVAEKIEQTMKSKKKRVVNVKGMEPPSEKMEMAQQLLKAKLNNDILVKRMNDLGMLYEKKENKDKMLEKSKNDVIAGILENVTEYGELPKDKLALKKEVGLLDDFNRLYKEQREYLQKVTKLIKIVQKLPNKTKSKDKTKSKSVKEKETDKTKQDFRQQPKKKKKTRKYVKKKKEKSTIISIEDTTIGKAQRSMK
jgi:hypothetical protein